MKIEKKLTSVIEMILSDLQDRDLEVNISKEELLKDILDIENIELFDTYELVLMVYKKLDVLDLINLEFIHTIIFDDIEDNHVKIEFIDPIDNKELVCKI